MRIFLKFTALLAAVLSVIATGYSADNSPEQAIENYKMMPAEAKIKYFSRKPLNLEKYPELKQMARAKQMAPKTGSKIMAKIDSLPANISSPGEFDESQAVFISWPSFAFDSLNRVVMPFLPGIGIYYIDDTHYEVVSIKGYIADTFSDSPYPPLWCKLADAIQKECKVLIRLSNPKDTASIKNLMAQKGTPLTNYEFIHDPDGENAFWARDFGPFGFYYGPGDTLGLVNTEYYPDRPIDNAFPDFLAKKLGVKSFHSPVEIEGGNYMSDGWGNGFYGNVLYNNNLDSLGDAFSYKKPMSIAEVDTEMKRIFNLSKNNILKSLSCDGGTGHIDIYLKMVDDETILATEYPEAFGNINFLDYYTAADNIKALKSSKSVYGNQLRILRVPLPTDDDGTYARKSCYSFNSDARGYINGLIVNKSFIFPSYSNDTSGNVSGDNEAVKVLRKHLPGYKIVPIDARLLTPMGGAIHCITMQIPADNPIRIFHSSTRDLQDLKSSYPIEAKITNRSGIKRAVCNWRKSGESTWNTVDLASDGTTFKAAIENTNFTKDDEIQYYIEAESNNGKTMTKPITAPEGYFSFYFQPPVSVEQTESIPAAASLSSPRPNPAKGRTSIDFSISAFSDVHIAITDLLGNEIQTIRDCAMQPGSYSVTFDCTGLAQGMYFITMKTAGTQLTTKLAVTE